MKDERNVPIGSKAPDVLEYLFASPILRRLHMLELQYYADLAEYRDCKGLGRQRRDKIKQRSSHS